MATVGPAEDAALSVSAPSNTADRNISLNGEEHGVAGLRLSLAQQRGTWHNDWSVIAEPNGAP